MIREAQPGDGPAIADLLARNPQAGRMLIAQARPDVFARRAAFAEAATLLVDGPGAPAAAATVAAKPVLVAGTRVTAGYVFDVVVDAPARGQGLARRLLHAAEEWVRERGALLVYATIIGGNTVSVAVFQAAGYRTRVPMGMRLFPVFRDRPDEPAPPPDWAAAAALVARAAEGHDLVPAALLDDPRATWSGLPGWRDEDAWVGPDTLMALWDHRAVTSPVPLRLPPELRVLAAAGRAARAARVPFPPVPRLGSPVAMGYLLAGGGRAGPMRAALLAAVARARTRGLDVVALPHPVGRRPEWARGAFSVGERYDVVVKPLAADLPPLGRRPVWADLTDL